MKKLFDNLPFRLLLGIIIGVILGQVFPESIMKVVVTLQYIMGQLITFCVPLIIIGFIAPSITKLGKNASRLLGVAIVIAYVSSVCAALMSTGAGYALIPHLSIDTEVAGLRTLPDVVFELNIPQIMSVMSALVLSVLVGLAATWTNSKLTCDFLGEFQNIVLDIVGKIIIPMLPFYIAATFCNLSYEGMITHQLPAFIQIILIVMAGHYIWLAVLYLLAGAYSGKNPWEVLRHYGPAYLTAVGTMSSAATLAVALDCARKSKVLRKDMVSFGIPLFANIHLCGSVLTEVFFCMTISKILYGHLPSIGTMLLFCALLGIFAIGAPGVPGGTVMASLGLITGVLMFDDAGTALMLAIFALQDSFGTACNVTGDGALTLMLTGYAEKHGIKNNDNIQSCQHIQRDIADVGALHVDDALVSAQAPCQLTVADIHGIDLDGAVLQHTIGKAAGGRTNVHTDLAVRRQRKALHCLFQFEAAAADIADVVAAHLDLGVFLYHLTSLVHLLLVDKNDTGHDEGFGALTALDHAVLHQILVQTNFQSVFSPFGSASRTASARCAASSPVACLI